MDDGWPARLARLSRRLLHPGRAPARVIEQTLREVSGFLTPLPHLPEALARPAGALRTVAEFGADPGALGMLLYEPAAPPRPGAPLLVLLHGCGQDAGGFALATGFMALADRVGAPLLLPEQQAGNNAGRCFNWFQPGDTRRGGGEAASIRQMVAHALGQFQGDPERVFLAGLSAGGAMAAALLASYPDAFAAGAVVAGVPVGVATDVSSALARMGRAGAQSRDVLVQLAAPVREGGVKWPRWPRLSVWHGAADATVDPRNADALVAQWTGVLGLPAEPDVDEQLALGVRRRAWGRSVEQWQLAGFGHAFPARLPGADPFVLPAPVSATEAIARFWGLVRG
jgi:poly(hydroxyalkanoate) depolymerase family esterase